MLTDEEKKKLNELTDKITLMGIRLNQLGYFPFIQMFATRESIYKAYDKNIEAMDRFITEYKQLRLKEVLG